MGLSLVYILVFPGFLFLSIYSMVFELIDRRLYARLQSRVGPPWFQPLADFIKLLSKETIIPKESDPRIFKMIPAFALAATATAFMYIPIWDTKSIYFFHSDLIVVLYFLTIPTLTFFLAGWFSSSLYAELGAIRVMTQFFAYEVPLYMAILGPALLAGSWSVSDVTQFYHQNPLLALCNIPGLAVALLATQGKLERAPFDIPDAETEIVGGTFTEFSGRLLALFRMAVDFELVVMAALISAVFLPIFITQNPILGFLLFIVKSLIVLFLLTLMRTALARLRIDQMVSFCWKVLAPVSLLQILIDLIVKGVLKA